MPLQNRVCVYLVGCLCPSNKKKTHTHNPSETFVQDKQISLVSLTLADLSCLKAITQNTFALLGLNMDTRCFVEC